MRNNLAVFFCFRPHHIDFNLLDLEAQNDRPDETENQARIAVDDVLGADRFQANLLRKNRTSVFSVKCSRVCDQSRCSGVEGNVHHDNIITIFVCGFVWVCVRLLLLQCAQIDRLTTYTTHTHTELFMYFSLSFVMLRATARCARFSKCDRPRRRPSGKQDVQQMTHRSPHQSCTPRNKNG